MNYRLLVQLVFIVGALVLFITAISKSFPSEEAFEAFVPQDNPVPALNKPTVTIGNAVIAVDIASTSAARTRGLSGRLALFDGQGMLFVFEREDYWGIWMKDMRITIDIVWADAQGRIVTIEHNVTPDSYPKTFEPTAPARYVLEVPGGYAQRNGIAEGMQIVI